MKLSYIIAIIVVAVSIGVIISTADSASQYVNFKQASLIAVDDNDSKVHVVGKLKKNNSGEIVGMYYNPAENPNLFIFTLIDNNNEEMVVEYRNPKPQDFDKSEQVVVVGSVVQNTFMADEILLKCPSKYQENEIKE